MTKEIKKVKETELVKIIEDNNLPQSKAEVLLSGFKDYFSESSELIAKGKSIKVADENDIESMDEARELRLKLQKIRVAAEKLRVELKADSRREGLAIDGVNNVLKANIVPAEKYLLEQEKFAERLAEQRKENKILKRLSIMSKYTEGIEDEDRPIAEGLSDDAFDNYINGLKVQAQTQKEAEEKAKKEQEEYERKQIVLRDREREILPYKAYYSTDFELTFNTTDEEYTKELEKVKERKSLSDKRRAEAIKEREKLEKKLEAETKKKAEIEAKLEAERKKLEKAKRDQEAKDKAEADAKREQELADIKAKEAEEQAQQEAERAKALAPDRDKLIELSKAISAIEMPAVKDRNARDLVTEVEKGLNDLVTLIVKTEI